VGDDWNLVFATEHGGPFYGNWITKWFQARLAAAGLPRQTFHNLRHTAARFMLAEGVSLRVVQKKLDHRQIAVTANAYSHVMPELEREAMEKVSGALWSS